MIYKIMTAIMFVISVNGVVLAALGPCGNTFAGNVVNTIACGPGPAPSCVGQFVANLPQNACLATDETTCTPLPFWPIWESFQPKVVLNSQGACGVAPVKWNCVKDLLARGVGGNGSDCI